MARAFAAAGGDAGGTRTTICARALEVEVTVRAEPEREAALDALVAGLREQLGEAIYAEDERPLSEHVLELLRGARPAPGGGRVLHGRASSPRGWPTSPAPRTCCSAA